jgi:hypothetical protein
VWRVAVCGVVTFALLANLTACAGRGGMRANKPVDAYVIYGQRIKTCWFNPVDPVLPDYVYYANVAPDGSKVKIGIYTRAELGRRGSLAYTIDFKQEGASVGMEPYNVRMPAYLAAKMQYDLSRWQRGETDCNTVMPAEAPPAAPSPTSE